MLDCNAGPGELLARALDEPVQRDPDGDGDEEVSAALSRLERTAYSDRPLLTKTGYTNLRALAIL
jgi:hypothetical protein